MPEYRPACLECDAIAQELREAYADAWVSGDDAFRNAWVATYRLIGGTEENAARADELISQTRFREQTRVTQALRRKFVHQAGSGHQIPLQIPSAGNSGR